MRPANTTGRQAAQRLRREGMPIRRIAHTLGVSYGAISHLLYARKRPAASATTVIKTYPVLSGFGSRACWDQPVTLPRITLIDGPYTGAAA